MGCTFCIYQMKEIEKELSFFMIVGINWLMLYAAHQDKYMNCWVRTRANFSFLFILIALWYNPIEKVRR